MQSPVRGAAERRFVDFHDTAAATHQGKSASAYRGEE
jgi:hypothetical protein